VAQGASNREVVQQYAEASARNDLDALGRLRHPEWTVQWPQSGELVHGNESFAAIVARYPGGKPTTEVSRIAGSEDRWVLAAGDQVVRIAGGGDFWSSEYVMTYPDGQVYNVVDLMELRGGLVHRETVYWAPPFEAPDWRRPFVEMPPAG